VTEREKLAGRNRLAEIREEKSDRDFCKSKKDSPEPPKLSLEPSRLEGQRDDLKLPERCCKMMAEE
jgi:hypothetical protein